MKKCMGQTLHTGSRRDQITLLHPLQLPKRSTTRPDSSVSEIPQSPITVLHFMQLEANFRVGIEEGICGLEDVTGINFV